MIEPHRPSVFFLGQMSGFLILAGAWMCHEPASRAADFPPVASLPEVKELPDPLLFLDGSKVKSHDDWSRRRVELKALFEHYMYGAAPSAPQGIKFTAHRVDKNYFGGKATKKEISIAYGPPGCPTLELLLVVPNGRKSPSPVFVGPNFCGNHTVVKDASVALPKGWMPKHCPGCENERATEAGRGAQVDVWNIEPSIDRGYAVATFYCGDLDPDRPDFSDGVHPHFLKPGQTSLGPADWGTISAWAWGVSRAVDYLVQDRDLDAQRVAAVGHSRLGKTVLLAAAMDERIALVIPHQAGCGGTAPSRGTIGESVKQINDRFPHWFCDHFLEFNEQVTRLPFDQHSLVALVAPRPVLFSNAVEDSWANPDGQFDVLKAAAPVYRFLGAEGLGADMPLERGKLLKSRLGYFIRGGQHSMNREDWQAFLDYADAQLK